MPPLQQGRTCLPLLPPLLLHGARSASEESVAEHVEIFEARLRSYPQWPEIDELEQCPACEVPAADRPGSTEGNA